MKFDNYSIRLLRNRDLFSYYQLVVNNRERLDDFFTGTVSKTKTFKDTKLFVAEIVQKSEERSYFPYVIIDDTNDTIIGFLDLKNIDWSVPKAEFGAYIDLKYSGKGIMRKSVTMFTDFCFDKYKLNKLYMRTHKNNIYAIKIAEKNGFEKEGVIRNDYKTSSGKLVDLVYYGRVK